MKFVYGAISALVLAATTAAAQPGASPDPAPPAVAPSYAPPAVVPEAVAPNVDRGMLDDANGGRSFFSPTALNDKAGTWSFSDYELVLLSLGYAPTDELSLSLTTMAPITTDVPLWLLASAKLQVLRAGALRIGLLGALTYERDSSSHDSFTVAELGGVASLCVDHDCRSLVSGFIGAGFANANQQAVPFLIAGSLILSVSQHVKLVGELDSAFVAGNINETANGALGWGGVRFTSPNIGVDLGFMRPIGIGDTGSLIALPFVSFTYRSS